MAVEEANYEIIKTNEIYEIRKYSDLIVVETITSNENSGFRKLFNYISGANEKNQEIKMTAPVTQIKKMVIHICSFIYHLNLIQRVYQIHQMQM